jgi:hypothetical protein
MDILTIPRDVPIWFEIVGRVDNVPASQPPVRFFANNTLKWWKRRKDESKSQNIL